MRHSWRCFLSVEDWVRYQESCCQYWLSISGGTKLNHWTETLSKPLSMDPKLFQSHCTGGVSLLHR